MLFRKFATPLLVVFFTILLVYAPSANVTVTPEDARTIAKEAYSDGYPLVDSYRIRYANFVDKDDDPANKQEHTCKHLKPLYIW